MSKKFAIAIPTINRIDLLSQALKEYERDFENTKIFILDNGNQNFQVSYTYHFLSIAEGGNFGVAKSWNYLCEKIFSYYDYRMAGYYDYALILNDDVYLGKTEAQIAEFLSNWSPNTFLVSTQGFCSFIISREIFDKIGKFDERFFPAYFEDNDYIRRMDMAGVHIHHDTFLNPVLYRQSASIERTPELNNGWMYNRKYYELKWGGVPGQERFSVPFNGSEVLAKDSSNISL
jgi:GT2 family glycosyltransferase